MNDQLATGFSRLVRRIETLDPSSRTGRVLRVHPGRIEASGPGAALGDFCEIDCSDPGADQESHQVLAEVAAVRDDHIVLVPLEPDARIYPDARVVAKISGGLVPAGDGFRGRVIDAFGAPLDEGGPILADIHLPAAGRVMRPLDRAGDARRLETGIRVIDTILPLSIGQRMGVFAASGVGKTTFLQQLTLQTECDQVVVCLVGERGQEVENFWGTIRRRPDADRFTCVASTSDMSAGLRARAVYQALALAEFWRDKGRHVLFVLDSVTRYAMALREIGLATGAPPTLRAYPPNVFSALPRIVERCGASRSGGAITAVMTVLAETDDVDDPIAEVMKSFLDGHILLSRTLAEQGHFPAIDVMRSVSRRSGDVMTADQKEAAGRILRLLSAYEEARLLVESGIYRAGTAPLVDEAVRLRPAIMEFLKQPLSEVAPFAASLDRLKQLAQTGGGHARKP